MTEPDQLAGVKGLWEALLSEGAIRDVRGQFLPFRVWASCFARPGDLRFVALPEEGAVLPLMHRADPKPGVTLRVLHSPQNFYWRCGYPIVGREMETPIVALLRHLKRLPDWDMLELGPMFTDWGGVNLLVEGGRRLSLSPRVLPHEVPAVTLTGDWEAYYAARGKSFRESTDKRERRLEKRHGEIRLEEVRGGSGLEGALGELYRIEASGWKGEQGTAILNDPQTEAFFTRLAHVAAEQGWLRLYLLYSGERCVAAQYALCYRKILYLMKFGYDAEWSSFSPGTLLLKHLFRRAFEDPEIEAADFLSPATGEGDYKNAWADGVHHYSTVQLFNPKSIPARLYLTGLAMKQAARQIRQRVVDAR